MKRTSLLASVMLAASIGAAAAAPPSPYWNWSGFYAGGNAGYSWGRSKNTVTFSDATTGTVFDQADSSFNLDGFIGGVQAGYNRQSGMWVTGIEADFDLSDQRGLRTILCPGGTGLPPFPAGFNGVCSNGVAGETITAPPVSAVLTQRLDWFGTVRGRLGAAIGPTLLPYVTAGLAYGDVHTTGTITGSNFDIMGNQTVVTGVVDSSVIKLGWTAGAGIEDALTDHWIGRVEYLYVDLGSVSGTIATAIVSSGGHFLAGSYTSHVTDNILRAGLSYKY